MGLASSTIRSKSGQSVEDRLETLVQHIGDSAIVHGLLQDIAGIINKNTVERDKFCALLFKASTEQDSLSLPANWMPLKELFSRVRLMPDANSRASVIHWLRHLTDANEEQCVGVLVGSDISSFVSDFYSFQANTHVAPETLMMMAQLMHRWSLHDVFARQVDSHDAFRIVLPRLRFSRVGSDERALLVQTMSRCYPSGLCRPESLELLLKIALDREELNDTILCCAFEMIAEAVRSRPDLAKHISLKQITSMCRHLQGSGDVIAATTKALANLHAALRALATGSVVMQMSMSSFEADVEPPQTEAAMSIIFQALDQLFHSDYLDAAGMPPETLLAARMITLQTSEHVLELVNPVSGAFATLVSRSHADLNKNEVCARFLALALHMVTLCPACAQGISSTPLVVDCFMESLVAAPQDILPKAVEAFAALCAADSHICLQICESRQFLLALRRITGLGSAGEVANVARQLSVCCVLKALLVSEVLSQADGMLILTMYSLLCQIFGQVIVPSKYAPNEEVTKIVEVVLDLLLQRCLLGPGYAESVLGLLPIDVARQVLSADHLPAAHQTAHRMIEVMANSSPQAHMELTLYGCIVPEDVKNAGSAKKKKVTLKSFQQHFKMVRFLKNSSRIRSQLASVTKDSFLQFLDIIDDEREQFLRVKDTRDRTMNVLRGHANDRAEVERHCFRQLNGLILNERNARFQLEARKMEQVEQVIRMNLVRSEGRERASLPEQSKIVIEEIVARSRITDGDYIVMRDIVFSRIGRFLSVAKESQIRVQTVVSDEALERRTLLRLYNEWFARTETQHQMYILEVEEAATRADLEARLSSEHTRITGSMYEMLLHQTEKEWLDFYTSITEEAAHWSDTCTTHWSEMVIMMHEDNHRNVSERTFELTWNFLLQHFVTIGEGAVRREESVARSVLTRSLTRSWKVATVLPHARLNLCAMEEIERSELAKQQRLGFNMTLEALRYTLPTVYEAEELSSRAELDLQYCELCVESKWRLAELKLFYDEMGARNAVALQYFYVGRTILTPFVCVRLLDYQRRLLARDTTLRVQLWIEEKSAFYELLFVSLREEQRHRRRSIIAELRTEEERLARHFVSVTHVVKLQEAAQAVLSKRLPPRKILTTVQ